jgi:hypothetical protein
LGRNSPLLLLARPGGGCGDEDRIETTQEEEPKQNESGVHIHIESSLVADWPTDFGRTIFFFLHVLPRPGRFWLSFFFLFLDRPRRSIEFVRSIAFNAKCFFD